MNIDLTEPLRAWVERQAARGGFASAGEYVAALVRRERDTLDPDGMIREWIAGEGEDPEAIPPERVTAAKQRLNAALVEGLNSGPAVELTRADWDELHRQLEEYIAELGDR